MKKILSVVLFVSLLFALSVSLTSCMHKCEFSTEWSKDNVSHWRTCTEDGCTEIDEKADHTWDEGEITTKATQEADGVKTFTCTVCSQTKTEPVIFTGLSKDEWAAAFSDSVFENFTYTEKGVTAGSGVSVDSETIYKFTADNAFVKMILAGQSQEMYAPSEKDANDLRKQLIDSIKAMTFHEDYQYDAETKTYKANKPIEIAALGASTSDITLTFTEGKLTEIKYEISFTQNNIAFTANATITLSDYGTVVLNPNA